MTSGALKVAREALIRVQEAARGGAEAGRIGKCIIPSVNIDQTVGIQNPWDYMVNLENKCISAGFYHPIMGFIPPIEGGLLM